jgi:hypothetical protein
LKRIVFPLLAIILATLACGKSTPTPAPAGTLTIKIAA